MQSWLPLELAAAVKQHAEHERRSVSAVIRLAVEDQLRQGRDGERGLGMSFEIKIPHHPDDRDQPLSEAIAENLDTAIADPEARHLACQLLLIAERDGHRTTGDLLDHVAHLDPLRAALGGDFVQLRPLLRPFRPYS